MMNRDALIAKHVEALIGLGWRWEGRGLIPCWLPGELFTEPECNQNAEQEPTDD
jgi:hypothetical protein